MVSIIDKIKEYLLGFFALASAILAALFFINRKKAQVLEAEKLNAETKGKVEEIDHQINDLEKQVEEKKNEPVTKDGLLKFLNDK